MDGAAEAVAKARVAVEMEWGEAEKYAALPAANKGMSSYPFGEMEAGGKVLKVRGRTLGTVRGAIKRYCRMQKAKDGRFKRRFAARQVRDEKGLLVKVWRVQ